MQRIQSAERQPDGSIKFREVQVEVPADAPPVWVENIYVRLFEKILPIKRNTTVDYYDAAILGHAYAAISRELAERMKACKSLPPDSKDRMVHEELATRY